MKKRILVISIFILVGCFHSLVAQNLNVIIEVMDAQTGMPIPSCKVGFITSEGQPVIYGTRTNSLGIVVLSVDSKPGETIRFFFEKQGYNTKNITFIVRSNIPNYLSVLLSKQASSYEAVYNEKITSATLLVESGNDLAGISLYEEAWELIKKQLIEEPENYDNMLADLANLYKKIKNFEKSNEIVDLILERGVFVFNEFKLPPPMPSAKKVLSKRLFLSIKTLADANITLLNALDSCGYDDRSYFGLPNGFALVARLEQINRDATPKPLPDRWRVDVNLSKAFSLKDYLETLFYGNPGYFRVIVFVVYDKPFNSSNVKLERKQAIHWLDAGLTVLPKEIAALEFTKNHYCTALIYEFELPESGAKANLLTPGNHTGKRHLVRAKLWETLYSVKKR